MYNYFFIFFIIIYIYKLNFWDMSGHPEFFEVRNEFYRDADGILLVLDVTIK